MPPAGPREMSKFPAHLLRGKLIEDSNCMLARLPLLHVPQAVTVTTRQDIAQDMNEASVSLRVWEHMPAEIHRIYGQRWVCGDCTSKGTGGLRYSSTGRA